MMKPDPNDHSFKNWFALMWGDKWIQLWFVALILQVIEWYYRFEILSLLRDMYYDDKSGLIMGIMMFSIPILILTIIGYKAFYQFWERYTRQ